MEPTKSKLPAEAVELYNLFIHGVISRRAFLDGIQRFAVGGVTAAALIAALMPDYAKGQQVAKNDDRIKSSYETVASPQGNGSIKGYLVRPVSADTRSAMPSKLPAILVVHENRGLNPHIEDIARRLALANFMAFAPDGLTSKGGYPGAGTPEPSQSKREPFQRRMWIRELFEHKHGELREPQLAGEEETDRAGSRR